MTIPKTLYISTDNNARVMRDGPALRVRQAFKADRLFPIIQVSDIIVSGKVQWDTNAMLYCAEKGIPIHFVNKNGSIRGHLISPVNQPYDIDLNEILQRYILLPNCFERFKSWTSVMNYLEWKRLASQLNLGIHQQSTVVAAEVILKKMKGLVRKSACRQFENRVYNLTVLNIANELIEKRIDIRDNGMALAKINLNAELSRLCHLNNIIPMIRFLRHHYHMARRKGDAMASISYRHAVEFSEMNKGRIVRIFDSYLRQCFQHMLESIHNDAFAP